MEEVLSSTRSNVLADRGQARRRVSLFSAHCSSHWSFACSSGSRIRFESPTETCERNLLGNRQVCPAVAGTSCLPAAGAGRVADAACTGDLQPSALRRVARPGTSNADNSYVGRCLWRGGYWLSRSTPLRRNRLLRAVNDPAHGGLWRSGPGFRDLWGKCIGWCDELKAQRKLKLKNDPSVTIGSAHSRFLSCCQLRERTQMRAGVLSWEVPSYALYQMHLCSYVHLSPGILPDPEGPRLFPGHHSYLCAVYESNRILAKCREVGCEQRFGSIAVSR